MLLPRCARRNPQLMAGHHRCRITETKGESHRLHNAKARARRTTVKQPNQSVDDAPASR